MRSLVKESLGACEQNFNFVPLGSPLILQYALLPAEFHSHGRKSRTFVFPRLCASRTHGRKFLISDILIDKPAETASCCIVRLNKLRRMFEITRIFCNLTFRSNNLWNAFVKFRRLSEKFSISNRFSRDGILLYP